MKKYTVYRTEKGNLTFLKQSEEAYTIRAKSYNSAKECLRMLVAAEKQLNKEEK